MTPGRGAKFKAAEQRTRGGTPASLERARRQPELRGLHGPSGFIDADLHKFTAADDATVIDEAHSRAGEMPNGRSAVPTYLQAAVVQPPLAVIAGMIHVGDEQTQRVPGAPAKQSQILGFRCGADNNVAGRVGEVWYAVMRKSSANPAYHMALAKRRRRQGQQFEQSGGSSRVQRIICQVQGWIET